MGLKTLDIQLDAKAITEEGEFKGYASRFGIKDSYRDIIEKGAFEKCLKKRGVEGIKMLWQHNREEVIGVWTEMREDSKGLYVEGQLLLDVQKGKEAYTLMKAGAIDAMSIGFQTIKSTEDKTGIRRIMQADLREVSLVTFPALDSATITGVKEEPWTKRDVEHILREAGMPNAMAVKLLAGGWEVANTAGQRDADSLKEVADILRNHKRAK